MPWAIWTELRRLGGAACALWLALAACTEVPPLPSVLLVTLDTLRRDHIGAYGSDAGLTPSLDALAAEGLVHDAAYTTMPTTGPAHLSLFTGLYPSEHGGRSNGEPLAPHVAGRELALRLRRNGFATAAFVTTRLIGPGVTGLRGFEIYDAPRGALRHGESAVESTLAWLDVEKNRPVFLWVHLYDPHAPYGTADDKRVGFPVNRKHHGWVDADHYADPAVRAEMEDRYTRGVRSVDAALGSLVAGVRERLDAPPLVIVAADHGESLAEHLDERGFAFDHGKFLDAESVAIPLVLAGPGVVPGRSAGAASIRDLYTVILEAAELGDETAAQEGRRDLRSPSDARRVVRIERRRFLSRVRDAVRGHAAAATDGRSLVIVAEDGGVSVGNVNEADLVSAAGDGLLVDESGRARVLDAETEAALRNLGYVE